MNPYFIMTVDVDSWSSLLGFYSIDHDPSKVDNQVNVEDGISKLLDLFGKHGIKATFFVPGEVAKRFAKVVRKIHGGGHEIACHGLTHEKNEFLQDKISQNRSIKEASRIFETIMGLRPLGFRAPCLRLNRITLDILNRYRFVYDSSIVSTYIPGYYGRPMAPLKPYYLTENYSGKKASLKLLEIPISVNPVIRVPISAAWMRNLGIKWVRFGVKANFLAKNPVIFYIHPRDVVSLPKVRGLPWHLYKNVGEPAMKMLDEIICFSQGFGAKFVRAIDFAKMKFATLT